MRAMITDERQAWDLFAGGEFGVLMGTLAGREMPEVIKG